MEERKREKNGFSEGEKEGLEKMVESFYKVVEESENDDEWKKKTSPEENGVFFFFCREIKRRRKWWNMEGSMGITVFYEREIPVLQMHFCSWHVAFSWFFFDHLIPSW